MSEISNERLSSVSIVNLTKSLAERTVGRLVELANLIPDVEHTADDIMTESKPDGRDLSSKWEYSFASVDQGQIVGFIIGYERAAEGNDQYPESSVYMSELAVDPTQRGRGLASALIQKYLQTALENGTTRFTLQTNSAQWNEPVRSLYEKFGFRIDGQKDYENRSDVIMRATSNEIKQALDENNVN